LGVGYVGQDQDQGGDWRWKQHNYRWKGKYVAPETGNFSDLLVSKTGRRPKYYVLEVLPFADKRALRKAETIAMHQCSEYGILLWNAERQDLRPNPTEEWEMCVDRTGRSEIIVLLENPQPRNFKWFTLGKEESALREQFKNEARRKR